MKKHLVLSTVLVALMAASAFASKPPSVENRGDFVRILEGEKPAGAPQDRDAPDILYLRRSQIQRVSIVFATRAAEFKVIVVTSGPTNTTRYDDDKLVVMNDAKSYIYNFPNEQTATAFCEALVTKN